MKLKEAPETVAEALTTTPEGMRTLLIEDHSGEIKVTIPDTWKVTMGAFQPGMDHSPTLRLYEGNDKQQRAMFRDVICFRDLGIKVERSRIDGETVVWETADESFRLSPAARNNAALRY